MATMNIDQLRKALDLATLLESQVENAHRGNREDDWILSQSRSLCEQLAERLQIAETQKLRQFKHQHQKT